MLQGNVNLRFPDDVLIESMSAVLKDHVSAFLFDCIVEQPTQSTIPLPTLLISLLLDYARVLGFEQNRELSKQHLLDPVIGDLARISLGNLSH